jgi:hypothetical protein
MNGTNGDIPSSADRQPLPFMEEVQDRQRAIAMHGAEPWNEPAEERRAARRRDLEMLRLSSLEAAFHVTEYIAGRLPAWKRAALEDIANPATALANLNRSIVQICLAEDRFDESREERAARRAEEAAARLKAEQAAEEQRAYSASQVRRAETKRQVQQTVRAIAVPTLRLKMSAPERERLFAGLFKDLDALDLYDGDPAPIIADACIRLGTPVYDPARHSADHRDRRARLVALARAHLAALDGPDGPDEGDDRQDDLPAANPPPFTGPAKPRGPPN